MPSCQHITLAMNELAHVQQCTECGCVSIDLGPTTLRVDAGALEALWVLLGEASARMYAQRHAEHEHARGFA